MAVYVDRLFETRPVWGETLWCHMTADSLEELHAMAARLGMPPEAFQDKRTPHYDLTPARRAMAVEFGAIEIDQYANARERARAKRRGGQ